jgi:hypothetical protein
MLPTSHHPRKNSSIAEITDLSADQHGDGAGGTEQAGEFGRQTENAAADAAIDDRRSHRPATECANKGHAPPPRQISAV